MKIFWTISLYKTVWNWIALLTLCHSTLILWRSKRRLFFCLSHSVGHLFLCVGSLSSSTSSVELQLVDRLSQVFLSFHPGPKAAAQPQTATPRRHISQLRWGSDEGVPCHFTSTRDIVCSFQTTQLWFHLSTERSLALWKVPLLFGKLQMCSDVSTHKHHFCLMFYSL